MQQKEILISVVIPVKNGAPWLHQCLQGIIGQTLFNKTEIIVVDSGSTDDTAEILQQYPVQVVSINPAEFNHGLTRNHALQFCKGSYVVMTVQDAWPTGENWLQKLLDGFIGDDVAAVCGQQVVPHDRAMNPIQWFRPVNSGSITKYNFESASAFDALSPLQKKTVCGWDNVTSCYRKSALKETPFREVVFAEDALWAMDALRKGYSIVYNTNARVYHYHHENVDFTFRRCLTEFYFRYIYFGYLPNTVKPGFIAKARMLKTLMKEKIPVKEKIYWWKYNMNCYHACIKAYDLFVAAVNNCNEAVEALHNKYCSTSPMSTQRENA